ncbi:MAG: glycine cleavage system protein GcvH [Candidatus Lokiarchaeota archaeon]|nr:glycine cleavage system protein GcvH [Candidatus Lokiarchaeota archaeon]
MEHEFPSELMYLQTHEWVRIQDNIATVGITDFAQHQLGDIVYVELPEIGSTFNKGSNVAEIESVKAVGELVMPLSGKILEVNTDLADNPELVNSSPYRTGWMVKIEPSNKRQINELLSVEAYKEIVEAEKK